jgi:hypothetical protein
MIQGTSQWAYAPGEGVAFGPANPPEGMVACDVEDMLEVSS